MSYKIYYDRRKNDPEFLQSRRDKEKRYRQRKKIERENQTSRPSSKQSKNALHEPEFSFVHIKAEPLENNSSFGCDLSYCRCCFKALEPTEAEHPDSEDALQDFQDLTQLALEFHPEVTSFCAECFDVIKSFKEFKKLATVRQEKFNEKLFYDSRDFSEIHSITLSSDQLSMCKEEPEDETCIKLEEMSGSYGMDGFAASGEDAAVTRRKPASKKDFSTSQNLRSEVPDVKSQNLRLDEISCDWCGFKSSSQSEVDAHKKATHGNRLQQTGNYKGP